MTDSVIIAVVLGTLGIAAVMHGGLDGFGPIAGTFGIAILVRQLVAWRSRRAQFPKARAITSRSEDPARPPDSAAD